MKNQLSYAFLLLCLPIMTVGQIAKNNTIFDGGIRVIANDENVSDRVELNSLATPNVLYFFSDKLAIGGQLTFGSIPDFGPIAGIKLDGRYYFGILDNQALFLTTDVGFTRFDATNTWRGNAGLGFDYFLTRSIAIESILSFGFTRYDNTFFETLPNELRMNIGTSIKIFFDKDFDYYKDRESVLRRGNFFIGGSFAGLEVIKVKQARNNGSTINIRPKFGYFLLKRLLIGTELSYFRNKASIGSANTSQVGMTGFLRYYLTSNANRGILFVELGRGRLKKKEPLPIRPGLVEVIKLPTSTISYGAIGIDFFFTPRVAIETKIGYDIDKAGFFDRQTEGLFDVSLQFFLGK